MTIQDRLHYAAENWKLTNISTIYEKETRAVYQADAAEWGKVIIKINADKKELFSEYSMLNAMKGSCCCAVLPLILPWESLQKNRLFLEMFCGKKKILQNE